MRCVIALLLVSIPAYAGSLALIVDASNPTWDSGAPMTPNVTAGLYVRLYGAVQGQPKTLLDAAPWAPSLKFRRPDTTSTSIHCYDARYALDTNGDMIPDVEGPPTMEWCGKFADPPPVLKLTAPNSIAGQAPAQ